MRKFILLLFIILNLVAIIITINHPLTISYFSLRVIFVAFIFIISIFLFLRTTNYELILSILSTVFAFVHIGLIIHSAYLYLY
ncbi:hypothetical protein J4711_10105 [Staphylococcus epidermidis]|nr:hypothetical protein [Staphylococcus epidermidis]